MEQLSRKKAHTSTLNDMCRHWDKGTSRLYKKRQ
ncbi:hypothetical protein ACTFIT_010705 [Dictyostelium discoideum]